MPITPLYICGSISDDPDYREKFQYVKNAAAKNSLGIPQIDRLKKAIVSPIDIADNYGYDLKTPWVKCMAADFDILEKLHTKYGCGIMLVIDDLKNSSGGKLEVIWANQRGWAVIHFEAIARWN